MTASVPPRVEKRPQERLVHGTTLRDDYAWLRAENWQEVLRDPDALQDDIRAYLQAENDYALDRLAPTKNLQEVLYEELKGRLKPDDSSVPSPDGSFAYYSRFRTGGQHRLHCRTAREGGEETILLDGDALAEGKAYFQMGAVAHSLDHARIAWSADEKGSEFYTVRVLECAVGSMLDDAVPDTSGGAVWASDGRSFFYVRVDENHRPSRVFRHVVGSPASSDALVYEEHDPGMFVSLSETQSARFGVISVHDHETSEAHLLDLGRPMPPPASSPRGMSVSAMRWSTIRRSTGGTASSFSPTPRAPRISRSSPLLWTSPDAVTGTDIEAHRIGRMILSIGVLGEWLVRLEREDGLPRIVVRDLTSGKEHAISFEEEAYSLGMDAGLEFETDTIRFVYSSMTTPSETYDYDMARRARVLRKRQEVPSGHDPSLYVTRRLFAPAGDGEAVPISLLYRKTTALDGSAPLLLYGYGAYGISIPAAFSTNALSLVDRGFVYAIAHIRGGTEKGWRWYRQGKLAHKTNSFHDFVAAGEHLVAERFTTRGRIVAHGGSAGGMLMGAVANLAPDLFGAIIAEVPFVDVLTTMLDDTLPLTPPEWPEWGNPIEDAGGLRADPRLQPRRQCGGQGLPADARPRRARPIPASPIGSRPNGSHGCGT